MCDTTFAFGQRGSAFFQCPSRREVARLPRKLSVLLSSAQLRQVHHVALGFEDSYLITWRDTSGQDHIDSQSLPLHLQEFLYARDGQQRYLRDVPCIRCSLGPYNSSFFAHDGVSYRWMNLPETLLTALQARIKDGDWLDRPRIVALGADKSFVLITEKHAAVWDLGSYKTVSDLLEFSRTQERGISEIQNIVLHSYRFGSFITQSRNGTLISEDLPSHTLGGLSALKDSILRDTKALERRPLVQRESDKRDNLQRRPSNLQQRAQVRREWSEHKQQFTAQTKGLKLSLSLSISAGSLARLLG
ncbi:hypothetical protein EK21DRAFT_107425 [Setomelanomma holmii]|uniref:Uncharacterized protein n=1 Tax=Setomelanomma holmii TaxID=210430 RepID=A0A9P4HHU2_9PLEO|nr:hypothetical protein EK21DRAFT_107425 [Setomelanomma holmii]